MFTQMLDTIFNITIWVLSSKKSVILNIKSRLAPLRTEAADSNEILSNALMAFSATSMYSRFCILDESAPMMDNGVH